MKAKIHSFSIIAIVMLAITSCINCGEPIPEFNMSDKKYPQFNGDWDWYKTNNGWGGPTTPATKGYTEFISLSADNIYKRTRTGVVIEEALY